jgi:hypothetical protein
LFLNRQKVRHPALIAANPLIAKPFRAIMDEIYGG